MELFGIHANQRYLLAVSGGQDSMVMADLFLKVWKNGKCEAIEVAHCNFQLRGLESEEEEAFVKEWCEMHSILFHTTRFNTQSFAVQENMSIQEAARHLRYEYFNSLAAQRNLHKICTAHHADDTIETILFHLFRGTGIKGLQGIPVNNDKLLRPILHIAKEEILNYANVNHIKYRQDSSNAKTVYTRNKIRHEIIPYIENSFPGFRQTMLQNSKRFAESIAIYEKAIQEAKDTLLERKGNAYYLPIRKLLKQVSARTILFELLQPFQFTSAQSAEVFTLLQRQSGVFIQNDQYRILKDRNFLILTDRRVANAEVILINDLDTVEAEYFSLHFTTKNAPFHITKNKEEAMVDASLLQFPLLLRKWRVGDYMYPLGMQKKKKIARILIDEKIAMANKENIWVVESSKKIIWLVGLKIDNRFKITEKTSRALQMQIKSKK